VIRLYKTNKVELAAYNIEDCRLVREIFAKTGLVDFAMQRARLTGLALDRHGGSVAAFDNLYLPRLHRKGFVAPDVGSTESGAGSPGGYVMDSRPGLYDNVLVLDFKSLYPSIIRTFNIDPLGLSQPGSDPLPGYEGAEFARGLAILPELIESLWQSRDEAKAQCDAPLSQAIKIIMNSFYGVLGTNGCRFYDSRLASSITRRGHEIILQSREQIEREGYEVIYGDTDSLFVLIGAQCSESSARDTGQRLAELLNDWWKQELERRFGIQSHLEIQFETLFIRFLMPTIRGTDKGSKKRYAGYIHTSGDEFKLVFKGLESVRTDWTPLAREFQRELYRRVFFSEPFHDFVKQTVTELMSGALDGKLVYRKRIRRPLDAYKRNVPPHVQAARKQKNPGRAVRYVITQQGPEPIDNRTSAIDYEHYRERQLRPVADSVLQFVGANFDDIVDEQLTIF
jgi:DNA polymerase-2